MRIALFGDSVFAGQGLAEADRPAARLRLAMPEARIVEAGIADETAADGLRRAGTIAADLVFVEFGLNDSFDGVPARETEASLSAIIDRLRAGGARVVLVEALVPPTSIWPGLVDQAGLARRVAEQAKIPFIPDILANEEAHRQTDGLHPDAEAARRLAARLAAFARDGE